jgi:thiamine monophosphate synthase
MILLAITPGTGFHPAAWKRVLRAGIDGLLIREKQLDARPLLEAARWCQDTAPEVRLWVAGRLDVALAAGCGLHAPEAHPEVPAGLAPLSRPLHAPSQWDARKDADQLLLSPVLPSPGKGEPWGAERAHAFLDALPAGGPTLLALGGVTPDTWGALRHPRWGGLAAIRPFWGEAPERAVEAFRHA